MRQKLKKNYRRSMGNSTKHWGNKDVFWGSMKK